jgi:hypothetical protein
MIAADHDLADLDLAGLAPRGENLRNFGHSQINCGHGNSTFDESADAFSTAQGFRQTRAPAWASWEPACHARAQKEAAGGKPQKRLTGFTMSA